MTRRRALLWPSLFWLVVILVGIALGAWQIQRLHWKEGLIAQRRVGMTAPPVALPETLTAARGLEFYHVRLEGSFLNDAELYHHAISTGGDAGFHVVTPFKLADGNIVMVDRGFVPEDRRNPATRAAGEIGGPTFITGLVRIPDKNSSWLTPANEPAANLWFTMDLPAMAIAARLDHVLPVYVDADASPVPGGLPVGGQTNAALPNDHLQYALTWFGLAGLAAIYYLLFVLRWRKEKQK